MGVFSLAGKVKHGLIFAARHYRYVGVQITCKYCDGGSWTYKGSASRATCPRCKRKNRVNLITASKAPMSPVQALHPNPVQLEKREEGMKSNPSQVPNDPKISHDPHEAAPVPRLELAKPKQPAETPQLLTNEQIDKIVELAERIRKSKAKQNGEIDLEKILSMSPNPMAAVKALERVELRREYLKMIDKIDYPNLSAKEKILFCEQIGCKEEAERLKEKLWNEQLYEKWNSLLMMMVIKRRGGYVGPILEKLVQYDYQEHLQRRQQVGA